MDHLIRARSKTKTPSMWMVFVIVMIVTCTITQFTSLSKYSVELKHLAKEVREANRDSIVKTIVEPADGAHLHLLEPNNTLDSQQNINHTKISYEVVSLVNDTNKSHDETFSDYSKKNQTSALLSLNNTSYVVDSLVSDVYKMDG